MTERALTVVEADTGEVTLFGSNDPRAIIGAATERANALAEVIEQKKLYTNISGRRHVQVEGWTLLGTLLGVFPVAQWTRLTEDGNGFLARVEARTLRGDLVGAAEAECSRAEPTWANRPDYALRSMAQTRATGKALRIPLGFVMALAGFDVTPAEEMVGLNQDDGPTRASAPTTQRAAPVRQAPPQSSVSQELVEGDEGVRLCDCGERRVRRDGIKDGRAWVGHFCTVKDGAGFKCAPIFENN